MIQSTPLTADDMERLARLWFADARLLSARDLAEFQAWKKEHSSWMQFPGAEAAAGDDGRVG